MSKPSNRNWLLFFQWLFALGFAVHLGRLAWIQLIDPTFPDETQIPETTDRRWVRPGQRGMILDTHGTPLAMSQTMLTLRADPSILSNEAPRMAAITAPWIGLPPDRLAELYKLRFYWNSNRVCIETNALGLRVTNSCPGLSPLQSVVIKDDLLPEEWETLRAHLRSLKFEEEETLKAYVKKHPRDRAKRAERAKLSARLHQLRVLGLSSDPREVRSYPNSNLAAHVIGYVVPATNRMGRPVDDLLGSMALERQFNEQLRGRVGAVETHKVNNQELAAQRELDLQPIHGMNLELTLDLGVQSIVENALARAATELKPLGITAVVIEPKSGDILALANWPTFVPDSLRSVTNNSQLLNRALFVPFEPGSTFKIFTYALGFESGHLLEDERIDCENGRWVRQIGKHRDVITDDHKAHGLVSLEESFGQSMNTVAAKIAMRVPELEFVGMLTNWGFGRPTGVPLGKESPGLVKHPSIRTGDYRWDTLTQSRMAYGYSLQVNAMQLALGVAAIANGGWLMEPRLVKRLVNPDGAVMRENPVRRLRRVVRPETAARVAHLMHAAVTNGTGRAAFLNEWTVAGKTGTARKYLRNEGYSTDHFYASFTGFLPVEDPQLAILVIVDEPTTAGKAYYGGKAAAPIFAEIARGTATYLAIKPSPRPAAPEPADHPAPTSPIVLPRPEGTNAAGTFSTPRSQLAVNP
jgi:cell division protein FtsI/penicillin-binding protein 2